MAEERKLATRRWIDMMDLTGDAVEVTGGSAEVVDVMGEYSKIAGNKVPCHKYGRISCW